MIQFKAADRVTLYLSQFEKKLFWDRSDWDRSDWDEYILFFPIIILPKN